MKTLLSSFFIVGILTIGGSALACGKNKSASHDSEEGVYTTASTETKKCIGKNCTSKKNATMAKTK